MFLTVQEMIEKAGFADFSILAGEAGLIENAVKTICVIDTAEIEGWLFGGEFLLSSGYIFRDDPEQLASLIETAHRDGAAALGIKVGRYIDQIPRNVLATADRLSFPLIGIPPHYAHTDIINPAFVTIADRRAEIMNQSEKIRTAFFDILIEDGSLEAILSHLREQIRRDILFVDTYTGARRTACDSVEFGQMADEAPLAFLMEHFPHEVVAVGLKTRGHLFINGEVGGKQGNIAMHHAKDALQLHLKWESEKWKIERGRGSYFVQDILYKRFRRESEIVSRARMLGWDFDSPQAVAFIAVDSTRSIRQTPEEPHVSAFKFFHTALGSIQTGDIPHTLMEGGMAFILKAPSASWRGMKQALADAFAGARRAARHKTGLHLVMGIGAPTESMMSCDRSFREALRVAAMAREGDGAQIPLFWEDMGVYRLLAPIVDSQESADFVDEYLGPLLGDGTVGGPRDSLLQTLFCVIRSNWQLKPVADEMNLHYNTVKYRYRRIEETLGFDLELPANRLNLALAMELYVLNRTKL